MEKKYFNVYEKIKRQIADGAYPFGSKLPSKRTTAETFGYSVITIEHAYELLASEGYVEARERSGYYVCYVVGDSFIGTAKKETLALNKKDVSFASEPFPFTVYAGAVRYVLTEYAERLYEKSPNTGTEELKQAICNYLARSRGIKATTERIIVGSGAEYLYGMITAMLGRDKIYAVEQPSYEKIENVYSANGVEIERLRLGNEGIISSELAQSKADVLHVTPFRSFPTGVTASASKKREYLLWAKNNLRRKGGLRRFIVEDDYESEFSLSPKTADTIFATDTDDCVIYCNTFSNTISPALRVGYMIIPDKLKETFKQEIGFYSCSVPVLEQYILAKLLNDGSFERHLNRVRRARKKQNSKR